VDAQVRTEAVAGTSPRRRTVAVSAIRAWLEPLRAALTSSTRPVSFFFRDDDAGWEDERLFELLEVFADHGVPIDLAVIPAALSLDLAAELQARRTRGVVRLHQHGYAHSNHEPEGRPCEFGPSRPGTAQRREIEAGADILRELLGSVLAPIFTPPWNRCTVETGRCLRDLGLSLSRDSTAPPLAIDGLAELPVAVDWSAGRRDLGLDDLGARLGAAARKSRPVGVMLHHAELRRQDSSALEELLATVTSHPNARCRTMTSLLGRAFTTASPKRQRSSRS
jgi:peptidoglycan/xylan/chitin deacetylase (PgdA/CDA1 family)